MLFRWQIYNPCHIKDGTHNSSSNSFQPLTFVTLSSILNAARIPDLSMPKGRREQNTHMVSNCYLGNSFIDASTASNMDEL